MSPLEPVALLGPTEARNLARPIAPVLIRVPALSAAPRRPSRFPVREDVEILRRPQPRMHVPTRRRRRLRREVRLVGAIIFVLLPGSWMAWSVPWQRALASSRAVVAAAETEASILAATDSAPIISLRLEPVSATAVSTVPVLAPDAQGPVALPGYVIPIDSSEEAAQHAGS